MRKDMRHVVIDKPRHASGAPNRKEKIKHKKRDLEHLPKHGSKHQTEKVKSLSDNLNPLRRFLEKQVGRPWNKVYAELCENLDKRNTLQNHVFEHIFDFVEQHVYFGEDGKLYEKPSAYWRGPPREVGPGVMYICPKSGLLKKTKGQRLSWSYRYRNPTPKPTYSLVTDDRKALARINGIWYELEYMIYYKKDVWKWSEDAVVIEENVGRPGCGYYQTQSFEFDTDKPLGMYPRQIYPEFDGSAPNVFKKSFRHDIAWTSKRQLSSEDLKRHGLQNDH